MPRASLGRKIRAYTIFPKNRVYHGCVKVLLYHERDIFVDLSALKMAKNGWRKYESGHFGDTRQEASA